MDGPTDSLQAKGISAPTMNHLQHNRLEPPHSQRWDRMEQNRSRPIIITEQRTDHRRAQTKEHPENLGEESTQPEMFVTFSNSAMKEQVAVLEEQRRELLSINRKWAEQYRSMIQFYEEKVHGLKALLAQHHLHLHTEDDLLPPAREQLNLLKTEQTHIKDKKSHKPESLTTQQEEAQRLGAQNAALTRRGQHQHEEIKRLNKALEETCQFSVPRKEGSETQEQLWKHQAEVYKEDFLKERRDREKLKEKHLELEKRFRKVHSELQALKSQVTWTPALPQLVPRQICTHHRAHKASRVGNSPPVGHDDNPHHH